MSTAIEFGEVFANPLVRHSMELASSVWGATVCVIDKDLTAHFPTTAPRLLRGLLEALLRHPPHREELVQTYSPLLVFSPDWTGPRWYEPFPGVRQLLAPAGAGCARPFLLCIPFVHQAET